MEGYVSWAGRCLENSRIVKTVRVRFSGFPPYINTHMSKPYIQLPDIYRTYIKDNILETISKVEKSYVRVGSLDTHSILRVPKLLILTEAGLVRFANYWRTIDVFRLPANSESALHVDKSYHAFNFVITNNGYMEWFDLTKLESDTPTPEGQSVYKFSLTALLEKTECNMMWVNTKVPHRVVNNTDAERWCISIRTLADIPVTI